jgi:hypothetical protein
MEPQARTYFLNAVLVFAPDLVVGWAAARLTDSGWYGFFITLIALQAIYFFSWFKKALWAWPLFWIYRKRQMAAYLENYFIDSHFPVPDEFTTDLDAISVKSPTTRNLTLPPALRRPLNSARLTGSRPLEGFRWSSSLTPPLKLP